jgi:hypothetical protein
MQALNQILEFLCYLFDSLYLVQISIEGYRARLSPVVSQAFGLDLSSMKVVSERMSSFKTQRLRKVPSLPDWDVTFVLLLLTKVPFEPLSEASLKDFTL